MAKNENLELSWKEQMEGHSDPKFIFKRLNKAFEILLKREDRRSWCVTDTVTSW